ncbi:glycosyltransferase [Svornostia abyssi]|uniref:Glycosyltransferase n=1 Tax=Svornostia abyssi TaxID=2898438 RepID=A0ABY5PE47_9ACTN|nr:glycosyltransferase [Parviterribacteraceae bacterium J379]
MFSSSTSRLVHHVDADAALERVYVPPGARGLFLVVHHNGAVVAHVPIDAHGVVSPDVQHAAIDAVAGDVIAFRRRRSRVEACLGRPAAPATTSRTITAAILHTADSDRLERCLESVRAQHRAPVEVIVVDHRHDPRAARVAADHGAQHVLAQFADVGAAWNHAFRIATGELVACLHGDVIVTHAWLDGIDAVFDDCRTAVVTGYVGPTAGLHPTPRAPGVPVPRGDRVRVDGDRGLPFARAGCIGSGANMIVRRILPGWSLRLPTRIEALPVGIVERLAFTELLRAGYRIEHDPGRIVLRDPPGPAGPRTRAHRGRQRVRSLPHVLAAVRRRPVSTAPPDAPAVPPVDRIDLRRERQGVSVAIASHNRRDALRDVLLGLADQTHPSDAMEAVVVLDGSTDGSAEMVRGMTLPYPVELLEQPNRGLASARNAAARVARHPLVLFTDDDIVPTAGLVAAHAEAHARLGTDGWVIGLTPPVVGDGWLDRWMRGWWLDHYGWLSQPGHRWGALDVNDGNASAPVRLWEAVGGLDESLAGRRQDHDLGARLLAAGVPIAMAEDAVGLHRLTVDPAVVVGNAHQEGYWDAAIAARHPDVAAGLSLARTGLSVRLHFTRLGAPRMHRVWLALVHAADKLPVSAPAERLLALCAWLAYLDGARAGVHAFGGPGLTAADRAEVVDVPLDGDATPPPFGPTAVLRLTVAGREVGHVRAASPGNQFDWDALVARVMALAP